MSFGTLKHLSYWLHSLFEPHSVYYDKFERKTGRRQGKKRGEREGGRERKEDHSALLQIGRGQFGDVSPYTGQNGLHEVFPSTNNGLHVLDFDKLSRNLGSFHLGFSGILQGSYHALSLKLVLSLSIPPSFFDPLQGVGSASEFNRSIWCSHCISRFSL